MAKKYIVKKEQNDISHKYLEVSDLREREQEILKDASARTGFVPTELIGRSAWWGSSEIGAFHYVGTFEEKKAVLKVQGVKPSISEIYMIDSFSEVNRSKVIRSPYLYTSLPWDEEKRYEALVLEYIDGQKVIQTPTTKTQVKRFFEIYRDYRNNCLQSPWVGKPKTSISADIVKNFKKWRETSYKIYPEHPLRKDGDADLIDTAVKKLDEGYKDVEPEFMHGHFSERDLYQVGDQVVVLSNLYWSWRQPFYDAIFGYHWYMYQLNTVDGITPEEVEQQRNMWLSEIEALPQAKTKEGKRLLNLALLERAAAGLNLDGLSSDPNKPISNYLMEATRDQIRKYLEIVKL